MDELNILVLDDELRVRDEIKEFLEKRKYVVHLTEKPSNAFALLEQVKIDIAIVDIKLPEMNGIEVLKIIKEKYPEIEVILISGHGDIETVIEAMRFGTFDYFRKPFRMTDIDLTIQRTHKFIQLNNRLKQSTQTISYLTNKLYNNKNIPLIGKSDALMQVVELMHRVANTDRTSILISGESGTGKDLVAQGIHFLSKRSNQPFHAVNCSAIHEHLFESEIFGHKKGAFTGANDDRMGWFEVANGGTIFLDEIGDMPLSQQAKLLRTIEEKTIMRVGSHQLIPVDVRVIAASNHDLEQMVSNNTFRSDLFHRLSTFVIHLVPLRERREDIPLLANYFIESFSISMKQATKYLSDEAMQYLTNYTYPGNIRELKNIIERAMILCDGKKIELKHLPRISTTGIKTKIVREKNDFDLEVIEKRTIVAALQATAYNRAKAALLLNITWQSLDRRMKKFEINENNN